MHHPEPPDKIDFPVSRARRKCFRLLLLTGTDASIPGNEIIAKTIWLENLKLPPASPISHQDLRDGFLGRWEGRRFLALLGNCDLITLDDTAKRLSNLVLATGIQWWGQSVRCAVTVHTPMAESSDAPRGVVRRLED